MKKIKYEVWCNGHYWETYKSREAAETVIRVNERQDRYERDTEGYTNPSPFTKSRRFDPLTPRAGNRPLK